MMIFVALFDTCTQCTKWQRNYSHSCYRSKKKTLYHWVLVYHIIRRDDYNRENDHYFDEFQISNDYNEKKISQINFTEF